MLSATDFMSRPDGPLAFATPNAHFMRLPHWDELCEFLLTCRRRKEANMSFNLAKKYVQSRSGIFLRNCGDFAFRVWVHKRKQIVCVLRPSPCSTSNLYIVDFLSLKFIGARTDWQCGVLVRMPPEQWGQGRPRMAKDGVPIGKSGYVIKSRRVTMCTFQVALAILQYCNGHSSFLDDTAKFKRKLEYAWQPTIFGHKHFVMTSKAQLVRDGCVRVCLANKYWLTRSTFPSFVLKQRLYWFPEMARLKKTIWLLKMCALCIATKLPLYVILEIFHWLKLSGECPLLSLEDHKKLERCKPENPDALCTQIVYMLNSNVCDVQTLRQSNFEAVAAAFTNDAFAVALFDRLRKVI